MNFNSMLNFQTGKNHLKQSNISEIHYGTECILRSFKNLSLRVLSITWDRKTETVTRCHKLRLQHHFLPFKSNLSLSPGRHQGKVLMPCELRQEARHVLQTQISWKISLPSPSPLTSSYLLRRRNKVNPIGWSLKTAFRCKAEKNDLNDVSLAEWFTMRLQG